MRVPLDPATAEPCVAHDVTPAIRQGGGVRNPMDTTLVTLNYLLYVILPLWLAAGVADWLCHRASHIATTSGAKESLIHLLMMGEAGLAVLLGLFLEINALVIAAMIACWLAHEITAHWDLRYAVTRREVRPIEQHVHNY